jgi:hypothetical protein
VRDGTRRDVTLIAATKAVAPATAWALRAQAANVVIVPLFGLIVFLRRANLLTAALFMTCLSTANNLGWAAVVPASLWFFGLAMALLTGAGPLGFILFCTRFPLEQQVGPRDLFRAAGLVAMWVLTFALLATFYAGFVSVHGASALYPAYSVLLVATYLGGSRRSAGVRSALPGR